MDLFTRALVFAAAKHRDQRRKDARGTPYIEHPIGVAHRLAEHGIYDVYTLAAAALHDTLEDTDTGEAELRREFGDRVADMVLECSDDRRLPKAQRKRLQVEHAATISMGAQLVKWADKMDNLADLAVNPPPTWDRARIEGYYVWAWHVVGALAYARVPNMAATSAAVFAGVHPDGWPLLPADHGAERLDAYYASLDGSTD
jgi:GTP diphosphokinase / guanosine-3',5'-bis(diphosphate) 3'-diphosphatase